MRVAHCTGEGFQFTAVVGDIATSCRCIPPPPSSCCYETINKIMNVTFSNYLMTCLGNSGNYKNPVCFQRALHLWSREMHQLCITVVLVGHKRNAPMLATYMLLWKIDWGENSLQPFSPTTVIVTIYNIRDIATTTIIASLS